MSGLIYELETSFTNATMTAGDFTVYETPQISIEMSLRIPSQRSRPNLQRTATDILSIRQEA